MNRWRVRWSIRPLCCSGVLLAQTACWPWSPLRRWPLRQGVILLSFYVGLDVGGRHQPHRVAQGLELTRPMMRRGAGLDADHAWRQLLKERQHVATLQLTADDHLASSINACT